MTKPDAPKIPEPDHTSSSEYRACYEERMRFWKICCDRAAQVKIMELERDTLKAELAVCKISLGNLSNENDELIAENQKYRQALRDAIEALEFAQNHGVSGYKSRETLAKLRSVLGDE